MPRHGNSHCRRRCRRHRRSWPPLHFPVKPTYAQFTMHGVQTHKHTLALTRRFVRLHTRSGAGCLVCVRVSLRRTHTHTLIHARAHMACAHHIYSITHGGFCVRQRACARTRSQSPTAAWRPLRPLWVRRPGFGERVRVCVCVIGICIWKYCVTLTGGDGKQASDT